MSILFYRRPSYVERPSGPINAAACERFVQRTKSSKGKVPPDLSFENVINNRCLPVCQEVVLPCIH